MRITDEDPDGYAEQQAKYKSSPSPNDIMSRLRTQSTVTAGGETVEIEPVTKTVVADVQGAKLKALLGNLKK
jgi:hypothetical protein